MTLGRGATLRSTPAFGRYPENGAGWRTRACCPTQKSSGTWYLGYCPEGEKKKDRSHRPDNVVSPWDGTRTCRPWNDPRGSRGHKEKKLKSVFSGSQDMLGLAGRGLVPSGRQYGAEGTRVPSWGSNSRLEPGWYKLCPLWKQQQKGVAPVSSNWLGWSVSTTAVFSPRLHLALAGPMFLGRGYGCYERVLGTKRDVCVRCQFGAQARHGTTEHPSQIYKCYQFQEDLASLLPFVMRSTWSRSEDGWNSLRSSSVRTCGGMPPLC